MLWNLEAAESLPPEVRTGPSGASPAVVEELRDWSDAAGTFHVQASLISVDGEQVTLQKADGTRINVPLDKLSSKDHAFLQERER